MFYVYMLNCINKNINKTYVGYCKNIKERLAKHNSGKGAKSTRGLMWEIIYLKKFNEKKKAMSYEFYLKNDKQKRLNIKLKKK
jgi:putative endonuclease